MHKITLNLEDTILKALKLKATETNQSMSELVNDALKASLQEDLEDIISVSYYSVPFHRQSVFKKLGHQSRDFPVAEKVAS